jgi:hypothetical protein
MFFFSVIEPEVLQDAMSDVVVEGVGPDSIRVPVTGLT